MVYGNVEHPQRRGTEVSGPGLRVGRIATFLAAALICTAGPSADAAQPPQRPGSGAAAIQVTKQVLPPLAHARFCVSHPDQCKRQAGAGVTNRPFSEQLAELIEINLKVNRQMKPEADSGAGGWADEWSLNPVQGDCEDYALLKRKQLLAMGWPSGKLKIATGHAVLVVRVNSQDVVLDNLTGAIRPWNETGYTFLKIQSDADPAAWFEVRNVQARAGQLS